MEPTLLRCRLFAGQNEQTLISHAILFVLLFFFLIRLEEHDPWTKLDRTEECGTHDYILQFQLLDERWQFDECS